MTTFVLRNRATRLGFALSLVATLGLTGCAATDGSADGTQPEARATFASPGPRLVVHTEFGQVDVAQADTDAVIVTRRTTAIGKRPQDPDWHLSGDTLELGSGCGAGFVGICEPTYTVTVPRGTTVDVHRD